MPEPMLGGGADEKQQLIRSEKAKTGYKGVVASKGRYMAQCDTAPCRINYLGIFGECGSYLQKSWRQQLDTCQSHRTRASPP